jgi:hypothetical protein
MVFFSTASMSITIGQKELELMQKKKLGSFYNFVINKLCTPATTDEIIKPYSTLAVSVHHTAKNLIAIKFFNRA